ncbi:MAG: hypothetical protein JXA09_07470 [Anaerolineae bacterium]|nr:hypothetical protein [Anaerolineae bacterium]
MVEPVHPATPRTLLLIDDHHVLYRSGTERVVRPFDRYPGNPVIRDRERPWEIALAWTSVYRCPHSGRYQLWYQAYAGREACDRRYRVVVCYAESADGLQFVKPDLDLYAFNDVQQTNIVLIGNGGTSDRYTNAVAVDPDALDPERRYKMASYDFALDGGQEYPGLCMAFSADGIHWTKHPHAPLLRTTYGRHDEPLPARGEPGREWDLPLSMSDALDLIYDPRRQVYAIYGKMWIDGPAGAMRWKHALGRTESTDGVHWSTPQLLLTPDEFDPPWVEFHTAPVFTYRECYLALIQILDRAERGGVIDIELAISRDGLSWQRPFRQPYVLPRSEQAGAFDSGSIFTNATPIVLPDEIRFCYGGYSQGATGADNHTHCSGIGLATLPRDRFAGLRPVARSDQPTLREPLLGVGQVTLKPVDLGEVGAIEVNADASRGAIRCELLDEGGYRIPGYSRDEALPLQGDNLRHTADWAERSLGDLPPGRYMLRIHLESATIYAVTLLPKRR